MYDLTHFPWPSRFYGILRPISPRPSRTFSSSSNPSILLSLASFRPCKAECITPVAQHQMVV